MSEQQEAPGALARSRGPKNQMDDGFEPIVPQHTDNAQSPALFPTGPVTVYARPVLVATAGRTEYAARCPQCHEWHRHVSLGEKTAPCGAVYLLEPRRGRRAA